MDPYAAPEGHRSGFIALAGKPNVGKSTLINQLLKQPIAAVSPRPQMTRRSQLGILSLPHVQIIFVDTPGLHQAKHKLGEQLNHEAQESIENADAILVLFDVDSPPSEEDRLVATHLIQLKEPKPMFVAFNKVDLLAPEVANKRFSEYQELLPETPVLGISALQGEGLVELIDELTEILPEGPRLYEQDEITLTYERDIAADLIRAAALKYLRDEVPHAIAIRIDAFNERGDHGAYIEATLFVERESQKGIVIGKGGSMLKKIGSDARKSMEDILDRRIFLELRVKVLPNWRNDPKTLQLFGYSRPTSDESEPSKGKR
jgi:GTP-binding protein Era